MTQPLVLDRRPPVEAAEVLVTPVLDTEAVLALWERFESQCRPTVFQSSLWIAPWLRATAGRFRVELLRIVNDEGTIALGMMVPRTIRRRFLSIRGAFLNETGPSDHDFCIEHNGLLVRPGFEPSALQALMQHFTDRRDLEELHLRNVRGFYGEALSAVSDGGRPRLRCQSKTSPYVDLARIRDSGGDYFASLSRNRRSQLRRAVKRLERLGSAQVTAARTREEAMAFFDGLKQLHQRYWRSRGEPGAFANPQRERFHRTLITEQVAQGGVQLLRVAFGETIVGYIYSLVNGGWVSMIQTGFNYDIDAKAHPGEVSHLLAIEWNLSRGNVAYDFLAGDARYKRSLANAADKMVDIVVQKRRLKFVIEATLRQLYQRGRATGRALF